MATGCIPLPECCLATKRWTGARVPSLHNRSRGHRGPDTRPWRPCGGRSRRRNA